MIAGYQAVQWNRKKIVYDAILIAAVAAYIVVFTWINAEWHPPKDQGDWADLRIRSLGTCAFLMLSFLLCIGPLARISPRFLPLLYNRRHFGVLTAIVVAAHAYSLIELYVVRNVFPSLIEELTNWPSYLMFIGFPYKTLGIAAFVVLFLMAATSHDFWLNFLGPRVWKALHMGVYVAYGLVIPHVALGVVQREYGLGLPLMLGISLATVATLHIVAAMRERKTDRGTGPNADGWISVGAPSSIPDKRAKIVAAPGGERIAVYRDGDQVGALTNVCAHQNGPIGEGCIVDGLVTCPWHGYQYKLEDGRAPPPFTEKLATYRVRYNAGTIEVDPRPLPPGTPAAIRVPREKM
jgi:nitrite reductase/ring-hydroxylating ferredoxin subunit